MKILQGAGLLLGLGVSVCFVGMQMDLPQHLLNDFLYRKLKHSKVQVSVGTISGFFPFSFRVHSVSISQKTQQGPRKISLKNTDVTLNWKTLRWSLDTEQVLLEPTPSSSEKEALPQTSPENFEMLGFFEDGQITPAFLCANLRSKKWLKHFQRVSVKTWKQDQKPLTGSLILRCCSLTKPFLEIQGKKGEKTWKVQVGDLHLTEKEMSFSFKVHSHAPKTVPQDVRGIGQLTDQKLEISLDIGPEFFPLQSGGREAILWGSRASLTCHLGHLKPFLEIFKKGIPQQSETALLAELSLEDRTQKYRIQSKVFSNGHITADVFRRKEYSIDPLSEESSLICVLMAHQRDKLGQANFWIRKNRTVDFDVSSFTPAEVPEEKEQPHSLIGSKMPAKKPPLLRKKEPKVLVPQYLQCRGSWSGPWSKGLLKIQSLKGNLRQVPLSLQKPVTVNLAQGSVSAGTLLIGEKQLRCSAVNWKTGKSADFSLSPLVITSVEDGNAIYWGHFGMKGTVTVKPHDFRGVVYLSSYKDSKTIQKLKSEGLMVQAFEPKIQGKITLSPGSFVVEELKLVRGKESLNLQLEALFQRGRDVLQAIGTLRKGTEEEPIGNPVRIRGSLKGTLGLDVLKPLFWNGDVIRGQLRSNLNFGGSLQEPKLEGDFSLQKGYYENIGNGVVLKDLTLLSKGQGSSLEIEAIRLTDGTSAGKRSLTQSPTFKVTAPPQGTAGGSGVITLLGNQGKWDPQFDVNLKCKSLQVVYTDVVKARATGSVSLKGPLHGGSALPVITGEVEMSPAHINIEAALEDLPTFDIRLKQKNASPEIVPSPVNPNRFRLDIALHTGEDVLVTGGNGLKCFLKGTMKACGPLRDPHLEGKVHFDNQRENTYNLFGRITKAQQGTIRYNALFPNIPYVKVTMQTVIRDVTIFANVYGYTTQLNYSLHSTPPLSNETLLSLLLFKQEMGELTFDQKQQVQAFSSQMLQDNPLGFLDKFRNSMRLDSLEVVEKQDLVSGETTQSVRLGKQLRKIRVYIDQDVSSKANSRMTVRYDITPQFGFQASVSTEKTQSGVGLQWSKRY